MVFSKKTLFLVVGLTCICIWQCKSAKKDTSTLESIIEQSIPIVGETFYNKNNTYLLIIEANTDTEFRKFAVIDLTLKEIVLEKKFRPGHVKWFDNSTIELLDSPGIIAENKKAEDYIQYISIHSSPKQ